MNKLCPHWISSDWRGNKVFQRFFALMLGLSLLGGVVSQTQASELAPKELSAQFEIHFLEGMIDHHAMAVHMTEPCKQKAQHKELITLCEQINSTQQQEIQQMQGWLQAWYQSTHEPQMNERYEHQMMQLASLNGKEFEIQFLKQMSDHHWQAIVESSQCLLGAYHEDLENLCQDIILAQAKEIQQMRNWLCKWYGLCGREANHDSVLSNLSKEHKSPREDSFDKVS